jgi:hypothetical protein
MSIAVWMSVPGEARANGIGERLPATRKIGAEELGTRVEVRASSIKLKRRYQAKTRGREKEPGREGKTNHHGGGSGSQNRGKLSTR